MNANRKKLYVSIAAAVLVAGLGLVQGEMSWVKATQAAEKVAVIESEVDVAKVVAATITDYQNYSGRIEAVDFVEIRPLVPGTIVAVHFKDGAMVKKGDPLFTIDPRLYDAEVARALAQLAAAQTRVGYTNTDAARAERLITENAISRRDYDLSQNAAREAQAGVKAAQAALDTARVNLSYTQVVAPVSGRVSRAELTIGNIVSAGANAPRLTTLVSVSPIYAAFDVDEQTYLRYLSHATGEVPVALGLANESGVSRNGVIDSVDNRLDTGSGTIRVRARFDNRDGVLVPGLFARLKVGGGAPHPAVLVDDTAVGTDQDMKYVMVVDADNRVQYRSVTIGALHEGMRVIDKGLQPNERIVVNGLQRVRANDVVKVKSVAMSGSAQSPADTVADAEHTSAPKS